MTESLPPVSRALTALNIPHTVFRHPGVVSSLEQAASERNQVPGQVIRSIVFRIGEGSFIMVLVAGPAQVAWPVLRKYLGQSRISMASEEEVLASTGYRIGTVSPIGLPAPMRILADQSIFLHDEISLGSGERNTGVILRSADLKRVLGEIEIGEFTQK